jgi:hypothetical protein
LNDIGFTAKSAIILPDLKKEQKCFDKPATVLFAVEVLAA